MSVPGKGIQPPTIKLYMKRLNKTEGPIFVLLCVLCFQKQPLRLLFYSVAALLNTIFICLMTLTNPLLYWVIFLFSLVFKFLYTHRNAYIRSKMTVKLTYLTINDIYIYRA